MVGGEGRERWDRIKKKKKKRKIKLQRKRNLKISELSWDPLLQLCPLKASKRLGIARYCAAMPDKGVTRSLVRLERCHSRLCDDIILRKHRDSDLDQNQLRWKHQSRSGDKKHTDNS
jgi:hypothetical protein